LTEEDGNMARVALSKLSVDDLRQRVEAEALALESIAGPMPRRTVRGALAQAAMAVQAGGPEARVPLHRIPGRISDPGDRI
jgi:hypothetical protein